MRNSAVLPKRIIIRFTSRLPSGNYNNAEEQGVSLLLRNSAVLPKRVLIRCVKMLFFTLPPYCLQAANQPGRTRSESPDAKLRSSSQAN